MRCLMRFLVGVAALGMAQSETTTSPTSVTTSVNRQTRELSGTAMRNPGTGGGYGYDMQTGGSNDWVPIVGNSISTNHGGAESAYSGGISPQLAHGLGGNLAYSPFGVGLPYYGLGGFGGLGSLGFGGAYGANFGGLGGGYSLAPSAAYGGHHFGGANVGSLLAGFGGYGGLLGGQEGVRMAYMLVPSGHSPQVVEDNEPKAVKVPFQVAIPPQIQMKIPKINYNVPITVPEKTVATPIVKQMQYPVDMPYALKVVRKVPQQPNPEASYTLPIYKSKYMFHPGGTATKVH